MEIHPFFLPRSKLSKKRIRESETSEKAEKEIVIEKSGLSCCTQDEIFNERLPEKILNVKEGSRNGELRMAKKQKKMKLPVAGNSEIKLERPSFSDLTDKDKEEIRKKLTNNSRAKGDCRIMTKYICRDREQFAALYCKGLSKRPPVWHFILTHEELYGEYDTSMYFLESTCPEVFCFYHYRLRSHSPPGKLMYEDLTAGDYEVAEETIKNCTTREPDTQCLLWTGFIDRQGLWICTISRADSQGPSICMANLQWENNHRRTLGTSRSQL